MIPRMKPLLDQIIVILEKSRALYQELLKLYDREKRAAMGPDPQLLVALTTEKEELLAQLEQQERQRMKLAERISEFLNVPVKQLNISVLVGYGDYDQSCRLIDLRDSLGGLVKSIQRANAENRVLFQHCLELVRNAMGFFQHWMTPASVYGSSGRVDSGHRSGKLLCGTI